MTGCVIRNTGSWYVVRTDDGQLLQCKVKGNFRLRGIRSTTPVAVGDRVIVSLCEGEPDTAFITEIEDRRNYIVRRASNLSKQSHILAANIDLVLLFFTLRHPETSSIFIDRFLASAEAYRIPVALIFNKKDLWGEEEKALAEEYKRIYEAMNYPCIAVSVKKQAGLEPLQALLQGKITLLAGNSGVGKSALLNYFVPEAQATTAPISETHDAGMHTTTFSALYDLPFGGSIIDIPGVKGFGTFNFAPEEVSHYFRDIFEVAQECRFSNCMHLNEPHCAVRQAVEEGKIAASRYNAYLSMLDDQEEDKYRPAY